MDLVARTTPVRPPAANRVAMMVPELTIPSLIYSIACQGLTGVWCPRKWNSLPIS